MEALPTTLKIMRKAIRDIEVANKVKFGDKTWERIHEALAEIDTHYDRQIQRIEHLRQPPKRCAHCFRYAGEYDEKEGENLIIGLLDDLPCCQLCAESAGEGT
jgi:hypothetical protein